MDYKCTYETWVENVEDPEVKSQLNEMSENEIEDAFYRDLAFGTVLGSNDFLPGDADKNLD